MSDQERIHNPGTDTTYLADDYEKHLSELKQERGDVLAGAHGYGRLETEQTAEAMAHASDMHIMDVQREEKRAAESLAAEDLANAEGKDFEATINGLDAHHLKRSAGISALKAYQEAKREGERQDRQNMSDEDMYALRKVERSKRRQQRNRYRNMSLPEGSLRLK